MTSCSRSLHPYLNLYQRHSSLLFQFILSDFFAIHALVQPLQATLSSANLFKKSDSYLAILRKLSGTSHDTARFFVWSREEGLVNKLKTYATLYAQNGFANPKGKIELDTAGITAMQEHKSILQIQRGANQALLCAIRCVDLLHTFNEQRYDNALSESFSATVQKLLSSLHRISRALIPLLESFRYDENVLFFILRHQKELHGIYGDTFLKEIMAKMHPEGLDLLQSYLVERFSRRGFTHLLPTIKSKIASLL